MVSHNTDDFWVDAPSGLGPEDRHRIEPKKDNFPFGMAAAIAVAGSIVISLASLLVGDAIRTKYTNKYNYEGIIAGERIYSKYHPLGSDTLIINPDGNEEAVSKIIYRGDFKRKSLEKVCITQSAANISTCYTFDDAGDRIFPDAYAKFSDYIDKIVKFKKEASLRAISP